MIDYVCNACGYLWSLIGGKPNRCPDCESTDIEELEDVSES